MKKEQNISHNCVGSQPIRNWNPSKILKLTALIFYYYYLSSFLLTLQFTWMTEPQKYKLILELIKARHLNEPNISGRKSADVDPYQFLMLFQSIYLLLAA